MRSEAEWIERARSKIPRLGEIPADVLDLVEAALAEHPRSVELWCMRGDLIQCAGEGLHGALSDAVHSYERALEADPTSFRAHESLGYYFDVIEEDFDRSESSFRAAIQHGAGVSSFAGLARVLAEKGRREEALALLTACPAAGTTEIEEARSEIERGTWDP